MLPVFWVRPMPLRTDERRKGTKEREETVSLHGYIYLWQKAQQLLARKHVGQELHGAARCAERGEAGGPGKNKDRLSFFFVLFVVLKHICLKPEEQKV